MKAREYHFTGVLVIFGTLILGIDLTGGSILSLESVALAAGEEPKDTIAAQIRAQGFACDKPRSAVRDAKKSKPDEAVWVLKCNNAAYRIRLNPDMAAKVERLQ